MKPEFGQSDQLGESGRVDESDQLAEKIFIFALSPCSIFAHLVVEHGLILAAFQNVLWKLDLHLLSSSSLLDLLLHIVVVPDGTIHNVKEKEKLIHLNGKGWGLSILSSYAETSLTKGWRTLELRS